MTLEDVIAHERHALMAEFLFPQGLAKIQVPPYCAIPNFGVLQRTPSILRSQYPVTLSELPGKKRGAAFVQTCKGLNYKFLWTHVDNDDYREDYATFLRQHQGVSLQKLPDSYHVDHLYNRARARGMQLFFIRMILLPRSINTSHGAGYEKSRTQGGIGTPGNQRGIDEIMLMKLWGIGGPRKGAPLTPQMQNHLSHMAHLFQIPFKELERNVRELMDVAAFRPPSS